MPRSAHKNIIFDWNSTLLDDFPLIHEATNCVLAEAGHPPISLDKFRASYDIPITRLYNNLGFAESEVANIMAHNQRVFHTSYEGRSQAAPLREGAVDLLQAAHAEGVKSYILSNYIVDPIRMHLRRLGVEHFFTEVLAYATHATQFLPMSKGEMLRRYMAEHNMTPDNTVIVGDSVEEIEIAHQQGLTGIAITGGGAREDQLRARKPHHVIHSLHEMKPILRKRGFVT